MLFFHRILTLMNDLFQRENQVFKPNSLLVPYLAGPFSPPSKCFDSYLYFSFYWIMLLFHCILTLINDLFQREIKVRKRTKIRNRYNQAPHPTQDTNRKVTLCEIKVQFDITNESQEVSHFPAGDHKASTNRRARKHNKN